MVSIPHWGEIFWGSPIRIENANSGLIPLNKNTMPSLENLFVFYLFLQIYALPLEPRFFLREGTIYMKDRKKYTKKNKNNFGTAVNFCFPNEKPYSLDELRFI